MEPVAFSCMYEDMITQAEPGCDVGGLRSDTSRLPRIGVTRLMGPHNCPITARMKEVCENARPGGAVPSQSSVTRYQTGGGAGADRAKSPCASS